jgi:hypothetical protein
MFAYAAFAAFALGAAWVALRLGRAWGNVRGARLVVWAPYAVALALSSLAMALGPRAFPAVVLPVAVVSVCATHVFAVTRSRGHASLSHADSGLSLHDRYALQRPRMLFGALIVVGGGLDLVPWAFAKTVGVGDIAVGALAMVLGHGKSRLSSGPRGLAIAFALIGIADLANALRLGVTVAVPALVERETPPMLLMLPFYVVPVFLAQHLLMLRSLWRVVPPE